MHSGNSVQRITIEDVAQRAGVSIATVSRVINGKRRVSQKSRAMVNAAIDELGYKPNAAAQGLARNKTNALGLVVDEIVGEYFQPMLRGIEVTTSLRGYDLVINSTHRVSKVGTYPLGEHNTDGLIIFADSLPDDELVRLYRHRFPMVLLHRSPPDGLDIPYVTVENKSGAREMMDYLIEVRGYRRIAFLRGPDGHEDSYWRERGYRESLEAHGLEFDPKLVGRGDFDEQQAMETVTQWIRRRVPMQAIFAADDDSAIGAMMALKNAGLHVPDAVAVVGFDDIRLARYFDPPLTTVRAPIEQAAQLAVEQLVSLIETGSAAQKILLPVELVIRRSCGCC